MRDQLLQSNDAALEAADEFQADALTVRIHADAGTVAAEAAEMARVHLQAALARQGSAAVILATGNSQLALLERLFGAPGLDWSRVTFFHMDEYLGLPATHAASFRQYLRERVERRIQARAFHYIEGDASEPLAECQRYAGLLRAQPIDLCFLGVGENGHLAFNDPPVARFDDPFAVKLVKLDEVCRQQQVKQGHFQSVEAMPPYAFTVTIPMLCSAQRLICLAQGRHKAGIIQRMLQGPVETACPASILRRQPQATLLLDRESARLL